MTPPTTRTDNPLEGEAVVVQVEAAETNNPISFPASLFQRTLSSIFCVALIIRGVVAALWSPGETAFGVIMPQSTLNFIINALLNFAEIKSQGNKDFPFQTHPYTVMISVTSLLLYGLASAAEHFLSSIHNGPPSAYAVVARLGRIASLFILVASLASLFYF